MRRKGFIFTMDAVLALIPIFVIIASISTMSSGGSILLLTQGLGNERVANDILRVLESRGDIRSANETALNATLESIVPSYMNYSYIVEYADTGATVLTIGRGDIVDATNLFTAKRTVSTGITPSYTLVVSPNLVVRTVIDSSDPVSFIDESYALNAVLYALLGIPSSIVGDTNFTSESEWSQIGEVTVTLGNFSTYWGSSPEDRTLGFLVDNLVDEANLQGKTTAATGLDKIRTRLGFNRSLTYDVSQILDPYPVNASLYNMTLSAADALFAVAQSINLPLGLTTTNMTSDDGNYRLVVSIDVATTSNISARTKNDVVFYSSKIENITVEVWNNVTYFPPNYSRLDTLELMITDRPCFNVTNIEVDTDNPGTTLVDIVSLTCGTFTVTGTNYTSGGAADTTGSLNSVTQLSGTLSPNQYTGEPVVEEAIAFNGTDNDLFNIYNQSITDAGTELDGVLNMFPLTWSSNTTMVKWGYVTVESVLYDVEQYLVTLNLWGE